MDSRNDSGCCYYTWKLKDALVVAADDSLHPDSLRKVRSHNPSKSFSDAHITGPFVSVFEAAAPSEVRSYSFPPSSAKRFVEVGTDSLMGQ